VDSEVKPHGHFVDEYGGLDGAMGPIAPWLAERLILQRNGMKTRYFELVREKQTAGWRRRREIEREIEWLKGWMV
jgi:hypothetical protein